MFLRGQGENDWKRLAFDRSMLFHLSDSHTYMYTKAENGKLITHAYDKIIQWKTKTIKYTVNNNSAALNNYREKTGNYCKLWLQCRKHLQACFLEFKWTLILLSVLQRYKYICLVIIMYLINRNFAFSYYIH